MEQNHHFELAEEYFRYLARRYPVMCASDEFHFLPRAQEAASYIHKLDWLTPESMEEDISILKDFQKRFRQLSGTQADPEVVIDLKLLTANAAGVLMELEGNQTWRHNPLLYLKIAFIGLDHALTKPAVDPAERMDRTFSRLNEIPRLIDQGIHNIQGIPESYHRAAIDMIEDCREYLIAETLNIPGIDSDRFQSIFNQAIQALNRFNKFLESALPVSDKRFAAASMEATLKDHFLYFRPLKEIYQIAVEEWDRNQKELEKLRQEIDSNASWQDLYHSYSPEGIDTPDTFSLYRDEINNICHFFQDMGLCGTDFFQTMELKETPRYLRSVRSGASFGASLTAGKQEKSYFYITTDGKGEDFDAHRKKRFHREFRFLVAHETIPGHHFLDSIRREMDNPVRRQIESSLFYEGWASFAESLLFEYGYLQNPLDRLVNCKRWLWRAARCQIDVGLPQGLLTENSAVELLITAGFSKVEAVKQIERFSLNPGYQLCYSLGSYEIKQIRKIYGNRLDRNVFYGHLLGGGELPFSIIRQRFEELIANQE
ncbi:MAG TPA: DUF885 family protein [Deltaproteobacteria bacterium]|nr:DUF885 family protein [Deltaproteobacteria bacterium]